MAVVSTRYAEALLNSAKDKEQLGEYLNAISSLYTLNPEFKQTMDNPRIESSTKLDIVKEIVPQDETFINFIKLILRENRINLIEDIYSKYMEMVNALNKVIVLEIVTASPIDDKQALEIAEKYKKIYGAKEVKYETKIDKSLIGGVKVIVDGKVYDATISTKLKEML